MLNEKKTTKYDWIDFVLVRFWFNLVFCNGVLIEYEVFQECLIFTNCMYVLIADANIYHGAKKLEPFVVFGSEWDFWRFVNM